MNSDDFAARIDDVLVGRVEVLTLTDGGLNTTIEVYLHRDRLQDSPVMTIDLGTIGHIRAATVKPSAFLEDTVELFSASGDMIGEFITSGWEVAE